MFPYLPFTVETVMQQADGAEVCGLVIADGLQDALPVVPDQLVSLFLGEAFQVAVLVEVHVLVLVGVPSTVLAGLFDLFLAHVFQMQVVGG